MSRSLAPAFVVTAALAASLLTTPAYAAPEFDITVTPDAAKPGATFTVSGDAVDPICAEDGVVVRLHYTRPDGSEGTVTANTTTDAAGHFSADLAVPDNAVAGEDARAVAFIADCTPPSGPSEGPRASESVAFDVVAHTGSFTVSATRGEPGDIVSFEGTNCWGGAVALFFGPEVFEGEPDADKTFGGEFQVPDLPDGTYELTAECPGTDYRVYSFRLINPEAAPPPAPPARPVTRQPTFTG